MIARSVPLFVWAVFVSVAASGPARAGVWGSQPDFGVSADYNSNPGLLTGVSGTDETHAALTLDAPTSYVGDAFKFSALPSFRLSDSQGYSQVDSDYEHLNLSTEFDRPRDVFTATAGVAQDSSLYRDYILNGSSGVRRDSLTGDLNWDRHLTERWETGTDLNWTRVHYAEPPGVATLTNYKYASIAPSVSWQQNERDKWTISLSGGRYDSLGGATESKSLSAQVGFSGQLSELWTLSLSGGYSRANNRAQGEECDPELLFFGICYPVFVQVESSQNGTVFLVNLLRQADRWSVSAVASRQLLPSGFAYLSRQESYELKVSDHPTERWSLSVDVRRIEYQQPEVTGGYADLNVTYANATAAWAWTPQWTLTLVASRVMDSSGFPIARVNNSGFSVQVSRQFQFKSFQ
jgi:hypothetical protein